jgi:hypothetical protein
MDGNGNIRINHLQKQSLQYSLIIKLPYNKYNFDMLIEIAKVLGGMVKTINNAEYVI